MAYADLVIEGAKVYTMNEKQPYADSIAIEGDKILYVGDNVGDLIGKETKTIKGDGKAVIPSFIDTHVHLVGTTLTRFDDLDVFGFTSLRGIFEEIKKINKPHGQWIQVRGFDDSMVEEQRYPNRWELDKVAPRNPLILKRLDGHSCVVNSTGLKEIDVPDGMIGLNRDDQRRATGVFRGEANKLAISEVRHKVSRESLISKLGEVCYYALSKGITTIHALDGTEDSQGYIRLLREMDLPVDLVIYYQTRNLEEVKSLGLPRIGGCLLVDGSMDSHSAAFFDPYNDKPSTRGFLYFTDEELREFVLDAHSSGLQIAMHAIGDSAIQQLIDAYESALYEHPKKDHRHRIEHAEVPTHEQVDRVGDLNIAVGVQPAFLHYWDMDLFYVKRLGRDRAERLHPYRKFMQEGILTAGGSDSPVTPMDPILGIHAAVNHPVKGSSIGVTDAIRLFTINAAKIAFEEDKKGSIETGKKADILILSEDPFKISKNRIKDIKVKNVIRNGKMVK